MTLLSRKADYSLLILSYLHDHPGTARAVADQFGLSRAFVANILKELCQHGFVASHRGVKGGYALARPANTITLADLLETVEDGVRLTVCNSGSHEADHDACSIAGTCTLKGPIGEVHSRLLDVLRGVTLGELFEARNEPARGSGLHALPILGPAGAATLKSPPV
jgi:Rrf2 family protein